MNGAEGSDVSSSADRSDGPSAFSGGRDVDHVPVHVLTYLVKQIGTSIGVNIASCIRSAPTGDVTLAPSTIADLSKVSLTVKPVKPDLMDESCNAQSHQDKVIPLYGRVLLAIL